MDLEPELRELEESHLRFEVRSSPDAMRALLADEIVRRSTAPGRKESQLAYAKHLQDAERRSKGKHRTAAARECPVSIESWTDARRVERSE